MNVDLKALAQRQLADYDAHRPGGIFAEGCSLTVDDAYRLQIEVAQLRQRRGEAVAGYKIGCVSPVVQRQLGVDAPVFGHVFATEVLPSGTALSSRDFDRLAIEGELAVELGEDVPEPTALCDSPSRYVASVFPVIELHHQVFRGAEPSAAELIANNAIHAGVVAAGSRETARGVYEVSVSVNGERRGVATPDPFATLYPLAQLLDAFGIRLRRGHILLTGSPLPLFAVQPGDVIQVDGSDAGEVEAAVTV